jgi:peroxiredoxin
MSDIIASPPVWQTRQWFNTRAPIALADLRGKVVALHTFQMLCPGCVAHGLPQAQRIFETFNRDDVAVIGLHTVFEHHDVMTPDALAAFIHEYRWTFPIGVDEPSDNAAVPRTMAAYGMQGTPSLLLFDRAGRLRWHRFGRPDDLTVGAEIMALVVEGRVGKHQPEQGSEPDGAVCTEDGCPVPV